MYCKYCLEVQSEQKRMFENKQIQQDQIIKNTFTIGTSRYKLNVLQDHATVSIKYVDSNYNPQEMLLQICEIQQKNAETIHQEIYQIHKKFDLQNNVICIATDGEIMLRSETNGVTGMLKKELPWLLHVNCKAHLTNLGLSDAIKQFPFLQQVKNDVFKICSFFSSKKSNNFTILKSKQEKEYLELKNQQYLEYKNTFRSKQLVKTLDIRWLSYLPSINRILEFFNSIIQSLEEIGSAECNQLLDKLKDIEIIYFLEVCKKILQELNYLIKYLQKINLNLIQVFNSYNTCINGLQLLIRNIKEFENIFISKLKIIDTKILYNQIQFGFGSLKSFKSKISQQSSILVQTISNLIQNLEKRFYLIDQIKGFIAFDINKIKQIDKQLLNSYCDEEVDILIKYYSQYNQTQENFQFDQNFQNKSRTKKLVFFQ
ncbi:hypothetical protein ABPG72_010548 [Tetrahymena utriculariae]